MCHILLNNPEHKEMGVTVFSLLIVVLLSEVLVYAAVCPNGYSLHKKDCYKIISTESSWSAARAYCLADHTDLISIHDETLFQYLGGLVVTYGYMWIGLRDVSLAGHYTWLDGENNVPSSWWYTGEPNNRGGLENCVQFFVAPHTLNDEHCERGYAFICGCPRADPICQPLCENGGTCIADDTCKCQPGFYGQRCEIGSDFDEKLKPQLNTTVPLSDAFKLMSWYTTPEMSDYSRSCFIKLHFQDPARDTLVQAESRQSVNTGELFGTYSAGPIDVQGQLNGSSRFTCVQVKCPGRSFNGTRIDVYVNVTVTSRYTKCVISSHALSLPNFHQDHESNSFGFTLEEGHNYGSAFGIYVGMGFRDMATHIARQSCFSGKRFDLINMNPSAGALANYVCT